MVHPIESNTKQNNYIKIHHVIRINLRKNVK